MGPEVAAVLPLEPYVKSPMGRQHRTGFSALVILLSLLIFIEVAFLWGWGWGCCCPGLRTQTCGEPVTSMLMIGTLSGNLLEGS